MADRAAASAILDTATTGRPDHEEPSSTPSPSQVQLHDRPDCRRPPTGEVVLRIDAAGICGSDMHAYHGHDPRRKPGLVLGHEFVGTVLQSAGALWRSGTRVTGNPLITCGTLRLLRAGAQQPVLPTAPWWA
jgi:threonine dehydrogenase-like Zn-dependent dehydrogenase